VAAPWVQDFTDFQRWLDDLIDRSGATQIPEPALIEEAPLTGEGELELVLIVLSDLELEFHDGAQLHVSITATEFHDADDGRIVNFTIDEYGYHYQNAAGDLIWRYDKDPRHSDDPGVGEHHMHDADNQRHACDPITLDAVLDLINHIAL
jgi:hypothetical protein